MITLKNDRITLEIAELGAEPRRLTLDGKEMLWSGDPAYWDGVSPLLFPICGGLRDDRFTHNGQTYSLGKHGFARDSVFTLVDEGCGYVTLELTDTPETLRHYPWHFSLRATFRLRGAALEVEYTVENRSDDVLYYAVGAHEAYACPEGVEDYDLIFPQKETLRACVLDGDLLAHETETILYESDTLPLYDKYFAIDALVFKDVRSRSVTLRNRKTGRKVSVAFPDCNYLLLWKKPKAGYLCIEPWTGIPAMVDDGYELSKKEGMQPLLPGAKATCRHTIWWE